MSIRHNSIAWAAISVAAFVYCMPAGAQEYVSLRPSEKERLFHSLSVEAKIAEVSAKLTNPKLAWMFTNCYPNTLDTTVHFSEREDGTPDTFVYTGDIHAMWLRDSGAQVWPYVRFADSDEGIRKLIAGVVNRQFKCINIDPYANAFNMGPTGSEWESDYTDMNPNDHERKYEIDSHCYPIRLAYEYWKVTGDTSIFGEEWLKSIRNTLTVFKDQQRKDGYGPYSFRRLTDAQYDTKSHGYGNPVKPCGLIVSSFRPSDDATVFDFLVPSNFFAVSALRKAAEILEKVNGDKATARECRRLADEVSKALRKHAVVKHPKFGKIYAYEVDGFGNCYMMDDANAPSLLSLPYLESVSPKDRIWKRTRKFILSEWNPFFFKGTAGEGVGGPHVGDFMIWPMSIIMRAMTSSDDEEIKACLEMLLSTDADTGFMHESFHKDDARDFTRSWFAWANTLFGELIVDLYDEGKLALLNSVK